MNNYHYSKVENVAMNYRWVPRLPFLYEVGENTWTGTDDAWANKAVAEIDREELIVNLQSASGDDAYQYLYSHQSYAGSGHPLCYLGKVECYSLIQVHEQ